MQTAMGERKDGEDEAAMEKSFRPRLRAMAAKPLRFPSSSRGRTHAGARSSTTSIQAHCLLTVVVSVMTAGACRERERPTGGSQPSSSSVPSASGRQPPPPLPPPPARTDRRPPTAVAPRDCRWTPLLLLSSPIADCQIASCPSPYACHRPSLRLSLFIRPLDHRGAFPTDA